MTCGVAYGEVGEHGVIGKQQGEEARGKNLHVTQRSATARGCQIESKSILHLEATERCETESAD